MALGTANWTTTNCRLYALNQADKINTNVRVDYNYTYTSTSAQGYNATVNTETALAKIPEKLGILAIAIIFSVILWVIMRVLPMKIGSVESP